MNKRPPPPPPPTRARARPSPSIRAAHEPRSRTMATTVSDGAGNPALREPLLNAERAPRRAPPPVVKIASPRPRVRAAVPKPKVDDQSTTMHEAAELVQARRLCTAGQFREAHELLEKALLEDPDNVACRRLLLRACIGLRMPDELATHGEWLIAYYVRAEQDLLVCEVYARIVKSKLDAPWRETTLTTVAFAAKRARKGSVLLDVTKRLLVLFPSSRALPSILLAAAERQAAKGRKDLARKTLRHIIARYPNHVEALRAEQRLTHSLAPRATRATR